MAKKEFCYRFYTKRKVLAPVGEPLRNGREVAAFARGAIYDDKEEMWREKCAAIFVDKSNRVIGYEVVSEGGVDSCILDEKIILRTAISVMADGVIVVHNHPSGNPLPSQRDIKQAEELRRACAAFGIHLLDSVILTEKEAFSFNEEVVIK